MQDDRQLRMLSGHYCFIIIDLIRTINYNMITLIIRF